MLLGKKRNKRKKKKNNKQTPKNKHIFYAPSRSKLYLICMLVMSIYVMFNWFTCDFLNKTKCLFLYKPKVDMALKPYIIIIKC